MKFLRDIEMEVVAVPRKKLQLGSVHTHPLPSCPRLMSNSIAPEVVVCIDFSTSGIRVSTALVA